MILSQKEIESLKQKYPELDYFDDEKVFLGSIAITEDDSYELEIDISNFPHQFPTVTEIGRIPRRIDRHVYANNTLCLTTQTIATLLLETHIKSVEDFITLILVPYLLNNSYYEINKSYRFGEYSHCHIQSVIESYQDILGTQSEHAIINFLIAVANHKKYRPNDLCFCCSNKKIKNCGNHLSILKIFQKKHRKGLYTDMLLAEISLTNLYIDTLRTKMISEILHQQKNIRTVNPQPQVNIT